MSEVETQIRELQSALFDRIGELAETVTDTVWNEAEYYRHGQLGRAEVCGSIRENLSFVFSGLDGTTTFDTDVAERVGTARAQIQVPLPAVIQAYRIGCRHIWEAIVTESTARPYMSQEALIRAASRTWVAQDVFTETMSDAYRKQTTEMILADAAERAALVEALIEGRVTDQGSVWELAQFLRLPVASQYVVVAATCPAVGRYAMPGIQSKLDSLDVPSAWRLLPDIQLGIVAVRDDAQFEAVCKTLERAAIARVGVSARYDDLRETPEAVKYARIALTANADNESLLGVFEDEALTIAAVSSPTVMKRLASGVFAGFEDLEEEERQVLFSTFRVWAEEAGSVNAAAERLYCHPNTVRHRLRRIEERSGKSTGRPLELAELCLAFEVERSLIAPDQEAQKANGHR